MRAFFQSLDDFLRGRGVFAVDAPLSGRFRWLVILLVTCGVFYGAVMGTFSGLAPGRLHQLLYSGVKVPLLLFATFCLCLPSFFVVNAVAGLREDFGQVLRAIIATQSCVTVVLAALAPLTALWYLSCPDYQLALLFNTAAFAVATLTARVVVKRYYAPLVRRSPRHRQLLWAWFLLYAFVAVQMAWVLRPFIGNPGGPVAFFRSAAWGNAYVVLGRLIIQTFRRLAPASALLGLWLAAMISVTAFAVALYLVFLSRYRPRS